MSKFFKLVLCVGLFNIPAAMAVIIAVPPSIFQEEENNLYITVGGGVGWEEGTDWTGLDGYYTLPDIDHSSTVAVGNAAIGYGFDDYPFRIELAYNFIGETDFTRDGSLVSSIVALDVVSSHVKTYTNLGMLNLYGDLPITDRWIPYVKIGAGFGVNSTKLTYSVPTTDDPLIPEIEYTSERVHTNNFVWNAGVGLNYAFSETWSLGAEVAYMGLGRAKIDALIPATDGNPEEQNVEIAEIQDLSALVVTLNLGFHF